jgi:general secretion pathway protein J
VTVAIAIFALLSAMSYGALTAVLQAGDHSRAAAERLEAVQRALWLLGGDLQQLRPRPVRDAFGDTVPALAAAGDGTLELTRGGWGNPLERPRSTLRRVGYRLDEEGLTRLTWDVLDRAPGAEPTADLLLPEVNRVAFRFLAEGDQWSESWPPPGSTDPAALPRAVEVAVELADWGIIRRLFRTRD